MTEAANEYFWLSGRISHEAFLENEFLVPMIRFGFALRKGDQRCIKPLAFRRIEACHGLGGLSYQHFKNW
jgi:hypothetical protein